MEEQNLMNGGDDRGKGFKMSLFEGGRLKSEQDADLQIPANKVGGQQCLTYDALQKYSLIHFTLYIPYKKSIFE